MIRLKDELTDVKTVAISGHIRPDGDCTGSCLGVWNYLRDNYPEIQADVYLEQIVPKFRLERRSGIWTPRSIQSALIITLPIRVLRM